MRDALSSVGEDDAMRCLIAIGAVATAAVSCRPSPAPALAAEPVLSSAPVVSQDAVLRIAGAACAREVGCGNVGSDRKFTHPAQCTVAASRAAEAEIGESHCPSGVSEESLARCLSDLRELVCSIQLEAAGRLPTCRRAALCGVPVTR
jgi:hypothetical protein